jgi:hypothetical protein
MNPSVDDDFEDAVYRRPWYAVAWIGFGVRHEHVSRIEGTGRVYVSTQWRRALADVRDLGKKSPNHGMNHLCL